MAQAVALAQPVIKNLRPPPVIKNLRPPPVIENLRPPPVIKNLQPPPVIKNLQPPPVIKNLRPPPVVTHMQHQKMSQSSSTSPSTSTASYTPASSSNLSSGSNFSSSRSGSRLDKFANSVEALDSCRVIEQPGPSSRGVGSDCSGAYGGVVVLGGGGGGGGGTRVKTKCNKVTMNETVSVDCLRVSGLPHHFLKLIPEQDSEDSLSALSPVYSDSDSTEFPSRFSKRGRFVNNDSSEEDDHNMAEDNIGNRYFTKVNSNEKREIVIEEIIPHDEIVYNVSDDDSDVVELSFDNDANNENNNDFAQGQLTNVSNNDSNSNNFSDNHDDSDTRLNFNHYRLNGNNNNINGGGIVEGVSEDIVRIRKRGNGSSWRQHTQQAVGASSSSSIAADDGAGAASSSSSIAADDGAGAASSSSSIAADNGASGASSSSSIAANDGAVAASSGSNGFAPNRFDFGNSSGVSKKGSNIGCDFFIFTQEGSSGNKWVMLRQEDDSSDSAEDTIVEQVPGGGDVSDGGGEGDISDYDGDISDGDEGDISDGSGEGDISDGGSGDSDEGDISDDGTGEVSNNGGDLIHFDDSDGEGNDDCGEEGDVSDEGGENYFNLRDDDTDSGEDDIGTFLDNIDDSDDSLIVVNTFP